MFGREREFPCHLVGNSGAAAGRIEVAGAGDVPAAAVAILVGTLGQQVHQSFRSSFAS